MDGAASGNSYQSIARAQPRQRLAWRCMAPHGDATLCGDVQLMGRVAALWQRIAAQRGRAMRDRPFADDDDSDSIFEFEDAAAPARRYARRITGIIRRALPVLLLTAL